MGRSIKISESAYQKIMERKPEKMSRTDFIDSLIDTAFSSLDIQEEMKENQNEILYKLREIWKIVHPAPDFAQEKAAAKSEKEKQEIEEKEFSAYVKNLMAGRKEEEDESFGDAD